ncbi:MAG: MazG family protein [Actinobacteria bacterium]|nr:MazG family protein [Actinomycetota bacterium]
MSTSYLQRLVEVMDTLRSPGGCPWDGEQTHESLVKYLLEESYEFVDSLESGDRAGMREELGDILLQVYFHARIAQDNVDDPFTIEDVAQSITEKLIRRHPHVFGDAKVSGSGEVLENWEKIKAVEKGRTSALDGIAMAQPALPLVEKLLYRVEKNDLELSLPTVPHLEGSATEDSVGKALLEVIAWANRNGIDAERALRSQAHQIIARIKEAEGKAE